MADTASASIRTLALLLVLSGSSQILLLGANAPGIDFYQFWAVARATAAPGPSIYDEERRAELGGELARLAQQAGSPRMQAAAASRQTLDPFGTPLLYLAFRPLSGFSYDLAYHLFRLFSLATFAAATLTLSRWLGVRATPALLLLAYLLHAFQPLRSDVRVANLNQLQLGLAVLYLLVAARGRVARQAAAGAMLAAIVLLKPNLALVVPCLAALYLGQKRLSKVLAQLAGGALGALACLLASSHPATRWADWLDAIRQLPPELTPIRLGNFALSRLLLEATGFDFGTLLLLAALALSLLALWRAGAKGTLAERQAECLALGCGAAVFLLSAPLVWQHYFVLSLPLLGAALTAPGGERETASGRGALAIAGLLSISIMPWANSFGITDLRAQAWVVGAGIVLLASLAWSTLIASPVAPPRPPGEVVDA